MIIYYVSIVWISGITRKSGIDLQYGFTFTPSEHRRKKSRLEIILS